MLPIGMKCRTSRYCLHELKTINFGFIGFSYVLLVCHWAVFANLGLWGVLSARVRLFWFLFHCYFACGVSLLSLFGLFLNSLRLLLFLPLESGFCQRLSNLALFLYFHLFCFSHCWASSFCFSAFRRGVSLLSVAWHTSNFCFCQQASNCNRCCWRLVSTQKPKRTLPSTLAATHTYTRFQDAGDCSGVPEVWTLVARRVKC